MVQWIACSPFTMGFGSPGVIPVVEIFFYELVFVFSENLKRYYTLLKTSSHDAFESLWLSIIPCWFLKLINPQKKKDLVVPEILTPQNDRQTDRHTWKTSKKNVFFSQTQYLFEICSKAKRIYKHCNYLLMVYHFLWQSYIL